MRVTVFKMPCHVAVDVRRLEFYDLDSNVMSHQVGSAKKSNVCGAIYRCRFTLPA